MMLSFEMANAVAQLAAERIADSLVIGVALAVFAWALLRVLPRQNSATRFAVWFAALMATAVLPWLNLGRQGSAVAGRLSSAHPLIFLPGSWAVYVFWAWAAIAAVALVRLGFGLVSLRRIRKTCHSLDVAEPGWHETAERLCPARRVEVLSSDDVHVPTALGLFRPAVVIPAALLQELTAAELRQVVLHELAHLRRWDDWTNLLQKFVKAVLYFHPAVWWMEERISLEREMACDDAVLAETSSPRAYAECLAALAEKSILRRSAELAQAAVNRVRQTTLRVAQILDTNRSSAARVRMSAVVLVGTFACACAVLAAYAPRLIAFQNSPAVVATVGVAPSAHAVSNMSAGARAVPDARLAPHVRAPRVAPHSVAMRSHSSLRKPHASNSMILFAKDTGKTESQMLALRRQCVTSDQSWQPRPQLIRANAPDLGQPAVTAGVLIMVVDDPVFGPTPILWRFAVWQFTPQPAPRAAEPALPQKSI